MKKVLHFSLSFLMIFTVAFATIETVDSEPVFAATGTPFPCKSDDGSLFGYQTKGDRSRGIQVSQFNVETGTTKVFNTRITHLGGKKITTKNFQSLQASSMDDKGHMFMAGEVAVRGDNDTSLYYLENGKTNARQVGKTLKTKGVMDASSYFEYGGEKFIVSANGFFSAAVGWKLPNNQNYIGSLFPPITFSVNSSSISKTTKIARTDDIAWLVDGSNYPKYAGLDPSFVGYDVEGQKVLLGYITSKVGNRFGITLREHSLALPSDWDSGQRVGAVFAFGGDSVYAVWNANGSVRKISYNGSSFVWKPELGKMTPTSNNDGSACHTGTPNQYWKPTASYSGQSSCDGEGKKIKVFLKNPLVIDKEGVKTQHYATYSSTDGQSGVLYNFTQDPGMNVTYFPGPAFAHGSVVTVNYTMTNLSDNEVVSGSFSPITINASECITTPTDPDSTFSQSLGSCSAATTSGTQTSTLSITNNASSTTYYKVEYSLDGGSTYSVAAANLSVAAGQTDTSISQAVTHGQQIMWRITDSDISNTFTGQSAESVNPSAVVSCVLDVNAGETFAACNALGSANEGTFKSTMTFYNRESQGVYLYADIRIDGGSWEVRGNQNLIGANSSFNRNYNSVPDGSTYQWRWRFGSTITELNNATWIEGPVSSAVDCPTEIGTGVTTSLGACGALAPNKQDITLTLSNDGPTAETSAYFYTEISLNGGDWSETPGSNQEVGVGQTFSEGWTVGDGDTVDFRYAVQNHPFTETPTSFTDVSFAEGAASLTIDCPSITIDPSVSVANGTCGGTTFGFRPQTFTMTNGSGADTTAYFKVEYNLNSNGWVTAVENQSVDIDSSETYTIDLMVGDTISWRYNVQNEPWEGDTSTPLPTRVSAGDVPTPGGGCDTQATSASTALGTCSGASVDSTLSINMKTYIDNYADGDNISTKPLKYYVQYQIDDGDWTDHTAESAAFGTGEGRDLVGATATFTQAVPDGSTINWRYRATPEGYSFGDITTADVISENGGEAVECPYINPTASSAIGACLQSDGSNNDGPATSTFTMENAGATRNAYFFVEYKINDGDWIEKDTNKQVAPDATETLTVDVPHGSTITWRYKSSITPRDFSTGSYTTLDESAVVNCPVIVVTATLTPTASCQDGVFTSFITIQNEDTANTSAFVEAYYSFDNTTWTAATLSGSNVSNLEIQDNTAKTLDGVVVPNGTTIYWRYRASVTSGSFSGSYTTTGPNDSPLSITADCPYLDPIITTSLGACNGTVAPSTLTIDNTLSNMTGYFKVEYRLDDGAWQEAASNESVEGGQSAVFSFDVPTASTAQWRYKISDTSNSFTEDYITTTSSSEVDCLTILPGWSVSTTCRGTQSQAVLTYSNEAGDTHAYFSVWYQINDGPFISKGADYSVAPGNRLSIGHDLEPGTRVRYVVKISDIPGEYTGSYQFTPYINVRDCSPTPTTTTTTPPVVKTPPVFKPIIENTRVCNANGGADYLLKIDNSKSTVGLSITTLVKVGDSQIINTTYIVPAGESRDIVTVSSVPEGTYYQIRFLVRDDIDGGTSKGVFKKLTDCIKDESSDVSTTTTTTIPDPNDLTAGCDTVFEGTCETPLTGEDGNDFFEWDDYDESLFLTDGDYVVQYIYKEDELPIAATGIFQDLYVFYFVALSTAGVVLLNWRPRRRKS
jgi:hypothetical protein